MSKKDKLLKKLQQKPIVKTFKKSELDTLMNQCGCTKYQGGRGSGIMYVHNETKTVLQFDGPHPGNELYIYHVKMVLEFLTKIGELK